MTLQLFAALFVFAGIAAFTPGPNNTLLMSSGMAYGFKRSLPSIFGVAFGFPLMIGLIGLGLGRVFDAYPEIYRIMKYVGAAYMLWLAYKIASAKMPGDEIEQSAKPLSFLQMVLFQWVNPKGWIIAVTVLSTYTVVSSYHLGVAVVVATFVLMGITSACTWVVFGSALRALMTDARYFRAINFALAALLVASLLPMLWH